MPNQDVDPPRNDWTELQDQYLAFIYGYATIHRRAPAEADMERFFRVLVPRERLPVLR